MADKKLLNLMDLSITKIKFIVLVCAHLLIVIGNMIGFCMMSLAGFANLFGYSDRIWWPVALACCSFVFSISFSREVCQATRWENKLREELGMPIIKGFMKHYVLKSVARVRRFKWSNLLTKLKH